MQHPETEINLNNKYAEIWLKKKSWNHIEWTYFWTSRRLFKFKKQKLTAVQVK